MSTLEPLNYITIPKNITAIRWEDNTLSDIAILEWLNETSQRYTARREYTGPQIVPNQQMKQRPYLSIINVNTQRRTSVPLNWYVYFENEFPEHLAVANSETFNSRFMLAGSTRRPMKLFSNYQQKNQ